MNCQQIRQHWDLFHDSEGDAEMHLQINEHLQQCPECALWFAQQSSVEEALTKAIQAGGAPSSALWDRIERQVAPAPAVSRRGWLFLGGAVLTLAASVLVAVSLGLWPASHSRDVPDLAQLSVDFHGKLTSGRERIAFSSSSPIEVEAYLRRQVSFPVRCPPRDDAGFQVRGGGTGSLVSDPVAYVVGHVDGRDVSLFIFSRESLAHFPREQEALRGGRTHHRREGDVDVLMTEFDRNLVVAVGPLRTDRLERLLKAYGSYPHGPGHAL
jgi:anti-sigma factor RsiW